MLFYNKFINKDFNNAGSGVKFPDVVSSVPVLNETLENDKSKFSEKVKLVISQLRAKALEKYGIFNPEPDVRIYSFVLKGREQYKINATKFDPINRELALLEDITLRVLKGVGNQAELKKVKEDFLASAKNIKI